MLEFLDDFTKRVAGGVIRDGKFYERGRDKAQKLIDRDVMRRESMRFVKFNWDTPIDSQAFVESLVNDSITVTV